MLQAHGALGSRLQEEQSSSSQLNSQLQSSLADAVRLRTVIADLEQQVKQCFVLFALYVSDTSYLMRTAAHGPTLIIAFNRQPSDA